VAVDPWDILDVAARSVPPTPPGSRAKVPRFVTGLLLVAVLVAGIAAVVLAFDA
jgi:hypothetical protein